MNDLPLILHVDDDAKFRAITRAVLESSGYRVTEAATAAAGLAALQREACALSIVDGLLPDGDGPALIKKMIATGRSGPVIFVSAFWRDNKSHHKLLSEIGVTAVLNKPLEVEAIRSAVARLVPPPRVADELGEVVASLGRSFAATLPAAVDRLVSLVSTSNTGGRAEAIGLAHRVHGTAGTHGFHLVSEIAGRLEAALRGKGSPQDTLAELSRAVGATCGAA